MYYKFRDECLIGVDQIDDEHRELFRLVGEVHDLLENNWTDDKYFEICDLIERLKEYAAEHFRHEEEYMVEIGHPELEMQKQQHALFCEKVNEVDLRAAESDQQELIGDLLSYLVEWLYKHIIGSDILIGKLTPVDEWKGRNEYGITDDYRIGVERIDNRHEELIKIFSELRHMVAHGDGENSDQIINLLKHFRNSLLVHIEDEEAYMESINYEELEVQKLAHDVFVARLKLMNLDGFDVTRQHELEQFVETISEWMIAHIMHMDKKIGKQ